MDLHLFIIQSGCQTKSSVTLMKLGLKREGPIFIYLHIVLSLFENR